MVKLDIAILLLLGALGAIIGRFAYLAAKKGVPAAWAWVQAWWNKGKADVAAIEARFQALEADVAKVKAAIAPPAAPAPAPAPAPAA